MNEFATRWAVNLSVPRLEDRKAIPNAPNSIILRGLTLHNLKGIDADIPLGQLTVVTGVSGSGKSSFAFDTLYAEARRRFVETCSPRTRQFLERLPRPPAVEIGPLPPAMAVRQRPHTWSARATVADAADLSAYFRLLFAKLGRIICPNCGAEIVPHSPATVSEHIATIPAGLRFQILSPFAEELTPHALAHIQGEGYDRAIVDGITTRLSEMKNAQDARSVWLLIDRLKTGGYTEERLRDSLETAFQQSGGACGILIDSDDSQHGEPFTVDEKDWRLTVFDQSLRCGKCERAMGMLPVARLGSAADGPSAQQRTSQHAPPRQRMPPTPQLFNPRSPLGACEKCGGRGEDDTLQTCAACRGRKLNDDALAVRIDGVNFAELLANDIDQVRSFARKISEHLDDRNRAIAGPVLTEILTRLDYLNAAGLGYLPLHRNARDLSQGEGRRLELTATLGSRLVNTLFVLDEPTAGLHPLDREKVRTAVHALKDMGNTVVAIEHDERFAQTADYHIEIGPGSGNEGGTVVYAGSADGHVPRRVAVSLKADVVAPSHWIELQGATFRNLNDIDVRIPLGCLSVIAGVSGSGKTSLLEGAFLSALRDHAEGRQPSSADRYRNIAGAEQVRTIVMADRAPVGTSPRSNPIIYLKAFDEIRKVYAESAEASLRGYTASHFSFNTKRGGRCPRCRGAGVIEIEMQFLADAEMTCPECAGTRYQREILDVKYRGLSIAEALSLTAREAFAFFRTQPKLQRRLQMLKEVGLDYLPLGQPLGTLSGGEAQRLKIAAALSAKAETGTVFLLDEPTWGLHPRDVEQLVELLSRMTALGHSVITADNNLQLLAAADWIIELGPAAGPDGGNVIASGRPKDLRKNPSSLIGFT